MDFIKFPKIPRWNRDVVITEKIDGTNAGIYFAEDVQPITMKSGRIVPFLCASRSRWVFPENDNRGFAKWAYTQDLEEWKKLGPGIHHGEWWGQGIQRGYGLKERRFSLFNTSRWTQENKPAHCHVVPILYQGSLLTEEELPADDYEQGGTILYSHVHIILHKLEKYGSSAAPGYMKPEGVVIFHTAGGHMYKATLKNDDRPKTSVETSG